MKRLVCIALILLMSLYAPAVLAAYLPGDMVTVTFRCVSAAGVSGTVSLNYDKSVLQYAGAVCSGDVMAPNASRFGLLNFGGSGLNGMVTYTFQIAQDALPDSYGITATVTGCYDTNGSQAVMTVTGDTKITVINGNCIHENLSMIAGINPTCDKDGLTAGYQCIQCEQMVIEQEILPATGHSVTYLDKVQEAMAGDQVRITISFECGDAANATIMWNYDESLVKMVQERVNPEDEYMWDAIFQVNKPGIVWIGPTISDCMTYGEFSVIVHSWNRLLLPEELLEIGEEAFANIQAEEVVLPPQVQSIGSRAFADNEQLVLVNIPASVTFIADDAFDGCTELILLVGEGNTYAAEYAETHDIRWRND